MQADELERCWGQVAEEVFTGMREWRSAHPRATLTEIEEALDTRLAAVRARMLEDVALRSAAADVAGMHPDDRPVCPTCGRQLQARGREQRTLTTQGDQSITLPRSRAVCPVCGAGVSPLDEELGLTPGRRTPSLQHSLTRLGTWLSFAAAAAMLTHFTGVSVELTRFGGRLNTWA